MTSGGSEMREDCKVCYGYTSETVIVIISWSCYEVVQLMAGKRRRLSGSEI